MVIRRGPLALITALALGTSAGCRCGSKGSQNNTAAAREGAQPDWEVNPQNYFGTVTVPKGRVLRTSFGPKILSLDPQQTQASWEMPYHVALGLTLVYLDEDAETLLPGFAERWEASDNGTTWTFHLRRGFHWHKFHGEAVYNEADNTMTVNGDGVVTLEEITSADVKYSWGRVLDVQSETPYRPLFRDIFLEGAEEYKAAIQAWTEAADKEKPAAKKKVDELLARIMSESIETPDPFTVVMHLDSPSKIMPEQMWFPVFAVVHRATVEKKYPGAEEGAKDQWTLPENATWSGGYVLAKRTDRVVYLIRVDDSPLWTKEHPGSPAVVGYQSEKCDDMTDMYERGELDALSTACRPPNAMVIEQNGRVRDLTLHPHARLNYMVLNWQRGILRNTQVRQAIAYAMDREDLVKQVLGGLDRVAGTFVPEGFAGFTAGKDYGFTFNLQKARALMEEAKAAMTKAGDYKPGDTLSITIKYRMRQNEVDLAQAFQRYMKEIGITVVLEQMEARAHSQDTNSGNFDAIAASWGSDYMAAMTWWVLALTGNHYNASKWTDSEFDRLAQQAFRTLDAQEALRLDRAAEKILMTRGVHVPLSWGTSVMLVKPYVRGITPNYPDHHFLHDMRIVVE